MIHREIDDECEIIHRIIKQLGIKLPIGESG